MKKLLNFIINKIFNFKTNNLYDIDFYDHSDFFSIRIIILCNHDLPNLEIHVKFVFFNTKVMLGGKK